MENQKTIFCDISGNYLIKKSAEEAKKIFAEANNITTEELNECIENPDTDGYPCYFIIGGNGYRDFDTLKQFADKYGAPKIMK